MDAYPTIVSIIWMLWTSLKAFANSLSLGAQNGTQLREPPSGRVPPHPHSQPQTQMQLPPQNQGAVPANWLVD